jgi:carbonic anhydrase
VSAIDEILAANRHYAANLHDPSASKPPARKLAVIACMDARIEPMKVLGIQTGEVHLIRNAGGRLADAVRSLVVSQAYLGTEEVAIIHHTDCGMQTFTDDELRKKLRDERGVDAHAMAFYPFQDLEQSVRDDLALYKITPMLRQDAIVRGFIFDVDTGALTEVEP